MPSVASSLSSGAWLAVNISGEYTNPRRPNRPNKIGGGSVENAARVRRIERERGYLRVEHLALLVYLPDAGRRRHIGSRRVAECLAGLQNRLLANDTRALYLLKPAMAIGDLPMPCGKLHGHI